MDHWPRRTRRHGLRPVRFFRWLRAGVGPRRRRLARSGAAHLRSPAAHPYGGPGGIAQRKRRRGSRAVRGCPAAPRRLKRPPSGAIISEGKDSEGLGLMKYLWRGGLAAALIVGNASGQTVVFSRSDTDSDTPAKAAPVTPAIAVSDAERGAITFLSYDLDVHLQPREHAMAVRARVQLRNDSSAPLNRLPRQISSTFRCHLVS